MDEYVTFINSMLSTNFNDYIVVYLRINEQTQILIY